MSAKALSNSLTAVVFALAFSTAFVLSAVGPAINAAQTYVA